VTTTSTSGTLTLVRGLGVSAATAIVIGDVIGTGVFLKARVMTCNVGTPGMVMAVWVVAGLLSVAGALTYAELAALMPRAGGEYVFIRQAYGPLPGFLYGWTRFFVATGGSVAGLATGFAIFINVVSGGSLQSHAIKVGLLGYELPITGLQAMAIAAILVATIANSVAVAVSGRIAVVLTLLKIALVLGVGLTAMLLAHGTWTHYALANDGGTCEGVAAAARGGAAGFGAAMLGALWAYNGWNEVTYVAEEVKDPKRNLPVAIIGGIGIIAALYIFANVAYFYVLSPTEVATIPASSSVATEVVTRALGGGAAIVLAGAMATSIFGSLQIASLVCARIPYAMARDGLFFSALAQVSPKSRVPIRALVAQGVWSTILVLSGSYDTLTDYAIFAILIFVGLATASVFVFRRRIVRLKPDATTEVRLRPDATVYRTWGYPVVPILFLLVSAWLVINTVMTTPGRALAGLGLMACGLPFFWYWRKQI